MKLSQVDTSEIAILSRVLEPDKPMLSPQAASEILALDFCAADKERMRQLSAKARAGNLTAVEKEEIENYERVGHVLNIMQAKARRSLKISPGSNSNPKSH